MNYCCRRILQTGLLPVLMFGLLQAAPAQELKLHTGTRVPVAHYPAKGNTVVLWLTSEAGILPSEKGFAVYLARKNVEVYMADMLDAHMLPTLRSSMVRIPAADVAALIDYVIKKSGKRLIVITAGRGAVPALRGIHYWQRSANPAQRQQLRGAVLLFPNLYMKIPAPGSHADYLPITDKIRLRIHIMQPMLSPWRWWLDRLQRRLQKAGSQVSVDMLNGVRDRFYYRPDATAAEDAMAGRLPVLLLGAVKKLNST